MAKIESRPETKKPTEVKPGQEGREPGARDDRNPRDLSNTNVRDPQQGRAPRSPTRQPGTAQAQPTTQSEGGLASPGSMPRGRDMMQAAKAAEAQQGERRTTETAREAKARTDQQQRTTTQQSQQTQQTQQNRVAAEQRTQSVAQQQPGQQRDQSPAARDQRRQQRTEASRMRRDQREREQKQRQERADKDRQRERVEIAADARDDAAIIRGNQRNQDIQRRTEGRGERGGAVDPTVSEAKDFFDKQSAELNGSTLATHGKGTVDILSRAVAQTAIGMTGDTGVGAAANATVDIPASTTLADRGGAAGGMRTIQDLAAYMTTDGGRAAQFLRDVGSNATAILQSQPWIQPSLLATARIVAHVQQPDNGVDVIRHDWFVRMAKQAMVKSKRVPTTAAECVAFVMAAAQGLDPDEVLQKMLEQRPLSVAARYPDPNMAYILEIFTNPTMSQPVEVSTVVNLYKGEQAEVGFRKLLERKGKVPFELAA